MTAKGWGRVNEDHADFIHFFFDSGNESTIAFFYYIGTTQPAELVVPRGYMAMANHTAWRVDSEDELMTWQHRLQSEGVKVSHFITHEIIDQSTSATRTDIPSELDRSRRGGTRRR